MRRLYCHTPWPYPGSSAGWSSSGAGFGSIITGFRSSPRVNNRNIGREGLGLCWSGSAFIVLLLPRPPARVRAKAEKKGPSPLRVMALCLSVWLLSGYITR